MADTKKNPDCPCKGGCPRQGDCEACREYHHSRGSKTTCERESGKKS